MESAMDDGEWWQSTFQGDTTNFSRDEVILALFQCPKIDLPPLGIKEATVYLQICFEGKMALTQHDWKRFLIRFGPFQKCVKKAVQCFQERDLLAPWFHGVISRAQAENVTKPSDDGAFLVRFSETQPEKFTLTYMKVHHDPMHIGQIGRKEIKNVLIVHKPELGYGLQDGGNGQMYPSISSFIEASSGRLRTPIVSRLSIETNRVLLEIQKSAKLFTPQPSANAEYGYLSGTDLVSTPPNASDYGVIPKPYTQYDYEPVRQLETTSFPASDEYANLTQNDFSNPGSNVYGSFHGLSHPIRPIVEANRSIPSPSPASQYGNFVSVPAATSYNLDYGQMPTQSTFSSSVNYHHLSEKHLQSQASGGYGNFAQTFETNSVSLPSSNLSNVPKVNTETSAYGSFNQITSNTAPVKRVMSDSSSDQYGSFAIDTTLTRSTSNDVYGHFVARSDTTLQTKQDALVQIERGMELYKQHNLEEAITCFLRAEFFSKTAGEKTVEARALGNLGTVCLDQHRPRDAVKYYIKCLVLTRDIEDKKRERVILNNLVLACMKAGDNAMALTYSQELLAITTMTANRAKTVHLYNNTRSDKRKLASNTGRSMMTHRHKFSEDEITSLKNLGREVCTIVAYAARRTDKSTVRWTPINPGAVNDPIELYVGECPVNDTLTFMCGVTRVRGANLEQVAALLNSDAEQAPAFHAAFYGDLSYYDSLISIRPSSKQYPRHALTIKRAVMPSPSRIVPPREFIYLEAQEDIMDTTRKTRGWVCAMHSVDLGTRSNDTDSVRGRLFRSGIVLNETQELNVVEVTYLLQIDFGGVVPMDVRRRMMGLRLHSLRFIGDHFRSSQHQTLRRVRSASSTPAMTELKRSSSGRFCACCGGKFHLLQRKYNCRVCGDIFCSHCGSQQRIAPGREKHSICNTCMVKERMGEKASLPKLSLDTSTIIHPTRDSLPEVTRSTYHSLPTRERSAPSLSSSSSSKQFTTLANGEIRARPTLTLNVSHSLSGHSSDIQTRHQDEGNSSSREGTILNLGDLGNASEMLAGIALNRPPVPIHRPPQRQEVVQDIGPDLYESIDGGSEDGETFVDNTSEWRGQIGPIGNNRSSAVVDLRDLKNASELLSALGQSQVVPIAKPALPQIAMHPANPIEDEDEPPELRRISCQQLPSFRENEDGVQFRAYGPPCVARDATFDFAVWGFLVEEQKAAEDPDEQITGSSTIALRRGALVHVDIEVPNDFEVLERPTEPITWLGDATNASFQIRTSMETKVGQAFIKATIVVGFSVVVIHSYFFVTSNRGETFEVKELRQEVEKLPLKHQEIAFHDIRLRNLLAHCHSGYSYRAEYEGQEVVVRMVRPNQFGENNNEIVKELRQEAAVLSMFGQHPYIVPFIGASTDINQPLSLVTKFLPDGNLENHFQKLRKLTRSEKNQILLDAAMGLLNIHEGGFVHRDVAARNCLVDTNIRGKICDFGMCRRVDSPEGAHFEDGGMGPLKYMAPESLQPPHIFSYRSDSYSFGVMMWETFTEAKPFANLSSAEAAAWVMEGGRLDHISDIPVEHRDIMAQCFQEAPAKRPSMADIVAHFRTLSIAKATP